MGRKKKGSQKVFKKITLKKNSLLLLKLKKFGKRKEEVHVLHFFN